MMEVISIDPATDQRWAWFIETHDEATIFHHPLWLQVLRETYGYRQQSLGVLCDDRLVGLMPIMEIRSWLTGRRGVCLPFSDSCGPLLEDNPAADALVAFCSNLLRTRGWRYLEIRQRVNHANLAPSSVFKSHAVPLSDDSQKHFHSFKRTHVQHIAKAGRDGVVVERRNDTSALKEFIRLNALTRKKHGVPPQPDRFFHLLQRYLLSAGYGFISLARLGSRSIAASLFLHYKNTLHYKYSASDESSLEHSPNHLIVWDAIQWACANGFRVLDFGRSEPENEGLLRYKRAWGAVESDLQYVHLCDKGGDRSGTTAAVLGRVKPVLRRLPIGALKFIGRVLYAHAE